MKKDPDGYDGSTALANKQREKFCIRYAAVANATQAYAYAYPKCNCPTSKGSRLVSFGNVRARCEFLSQKALSGLQITSERILAEQARLAFADPGDMFDEDGKMLAIPDMPEDIRRCIAGFDSITTQTEGGAHRLIEKPRLISKSQALKDLMTHLGLFQADNEQKNEDWLKYKAWLASA